MGENEKNNWDKAKEYTKYEIGRKISKNTESFSD